MNIRPFALLLSSLLALNLVADEGDPVEYRRSSVIERSPFAKSDRPGRKGVSGDALELRGFFGSGDNLQVSLMRPDTRESAWVTVGDKNAKWVVETADIQAGTAEVVLDGLRLNLKLAQPEVPDINAPGNRGGRGNWPGSGMSNESRQVMRDTMRASMERAAREHPEWSNGTQLNEAQQKERAEYMRNSFNQAREAVAKISPADAQMLGGAQPMVMPVQPVQPAAPAQQPAQSQGNNNSGQSRNRGGNNSGGAPRSR